MVESPETSDRPPGSQGQSRADGQEVSWEMQAEATWLKALTAQLRWMNLSELQGHGHP